MRTNSAQSQGQRQLSSRQSLARQTMVKGGKQEKIQDTRKIRDAEYIKQCAVRVYESLKDSGIEQLPTISQLQSGIALKPFLIMVDHVIQNLDLQLNKKLCDLKDQNDIGELLTQIQTQLGYPETNIIKTTDLKSCSSASTWRKFLLFLSWLIELADYVSQLNNQQAENGAEFIFIKELCASSEPTKMIESKQYFDFLSVQYGEFIQNNGSEQQLKQNLQVLFNLWVDEAKQNEDKLLNDIKRIDLDIKRQRQDIENQVVAAKQELSTVMETAISCQLDLNMQSDTSYIQSSVIEVNPQQLIELKQRNMQRLTEANKKIEDKVLQLEQTTIPQLVERKAFLTGQLQLNQEKVKQSQSQLELLQQNINQQDMSFADYNKIQFQNTQLMVQLNQLETDIREVNKAIEERQERKNKIQKQIQQVTTSMQLNQNISIEEIQKLQQENRKKQLDLDKQHQEQQRHFNEAENEKSNLEQQITSLQEQLNIAQRRAHTVKEEKDKEFQNQQQINERYSQNINKLVVEINDLKDKKQKIVTDIEDTKGLLQQQTIILDREEKRCKSEMSKLLNTIAQIYEKIVQSRQKARHALEMVRDKLGDALEGVK